MDTKEEILKTIIEECSTSHERLDGYSLPTVHRIANFYSDQQNKELLEENKILKDRIEVNGKYIKDLVCCRDEFQSDLSKANERISDLEESHKLNKDLLIDVCEYFTSAEDKEMDKYDLENWIEQLGYKLNLALTNYKPKQKKEI